MLLVGCEEIVEEVPRTPISVFPNPFMNEFTVFIRPSGISQAELRVVSGADEAIISFSEVSSGDQFFINMSEQEVGIYYVELTVDGQTYLEPVIKSE